MSVVRDPTFTDRTVTGRSTACVCAGPDAPARVGDARSQRAHVPVRARARLAVSSRSREVPSIENASEVLDASVAREHRRVRLLRGGPLPVKAIAGRFDLGRPAISEHLKVLKDAGLVVEERRGRENHDHLEAAPLRGVGEWLEP
jgi:DNA-binding transcriptional ArsR family regulator